MCVCIFKHIKNLINHRYKSLQRKKHYWRLDTKSITLFQNENSSKYYKEIPLSEISAIETAKTPRSCMYVLVKQVRSVV